MPGGLGDHVLTSGVAGGEVEAQPAKLPDGVLFDVAELSVMSRLLGLGLDRGEAPLDPLTERACGARVAQDK
jgi:hypothetical protein